MKKIIISLLLISAYLALYSQELIATYFAQQSYNIYCSFIDNDTIWAGTSGDIMKVSLDGVVQGIISSYVGLEIGVVYDAKLGKDGTKWFVTSRGLIKCKRGI